MAQLAAVRVHSDAAGKCSRVALHPTSHLLLHEHRALEHVWGFAHVRMGEYHRVVTLADVEDVVGRGKPKLACVVLELPQRENGGATPSWTDLVAISALCKKHGIAVHMDGARLWECQPAIGKSLETICALFDSVYVSFYKGLNGLCGAMLLGKRTFVEQARIWQRRLGGNLYTVAPLEVSCKFQFRSLLPTFPSRVARMRQVVTAVSQRLAARGAHMWFDPPVPQSSMVHVYLPGPRSVLERVFAELELQMGIVLCRRLRDVPQYKLQPTEDFVDAAPPDALPREVQPDAITVMTGGTGTGGGPMDKYRRGADGSVMYDATTRSSSSGMARARARKKKMERERNRRRRARKAQGRDAGVYSKLQPGPPQDHGSGRPRHRLGHEEEDQ